MHVCRKLVSGPRPSTNEPYNPSAPYPYGPYSTGSGAMPFMPAPGGPPPPPYSAYPSRTSVPYAVQQPAGSKTAPFMPAPALLSGATPYMPASVTPPALSYSAYPTRMSGTDGRMPYGRRPTQDVPFAAHHSAGFGSAPPRSVVVDQDCQHGSHYGTFLRMVYA